MLTEDQARELADMLDRAERERVECPLISQAHPGMTMDDAYAVQAAWVGQKLAAGRRVIGWKIGLTSRAMQQALNIDTPDSGVLLDDMLFANGATIPAGRFIQPRVEAEIAFIMSADLEGANVSRDDVLAATGHIAPALEILDTRVQRRDPATGHVRNVIDTIADNAANAGIVLGDRHLDPVRTDMRWMGAIVGRDDVVEETGLGAGVLGDPVMGIVWLVHRMARYGQRLRRGDVVLSGSFIRPIETAPGVLIHADFGPYGEVSCRFE